MASKVGLLLGALAASAVGLFVFGGTASASPAGFAIPKNAVRLRLPAVNGGIAIDVAEWPADPGQPPGTFGLLWDPADPATFVAVFTPTGGNLAVMAAGKTTNSQLLLTTLPGIIARAQQARGG